MSPYQITVCGLGPGGLADISERTKQAIASADRCFLRTSRHPSASLAPGAASFDHLYESADTFDEVYLAIAAELKAAAATGASVTYVVPGSPLVLERSVRYLREDPEVEVTLLPAVSFLDSIWATLGIDPVEASVRLVDGHTFARDAAGERGHCWLLTRTPIGCCLRSSWQSMPVLSRRRSSSRRSGPQMSELLRSNGQT